MDVNVTLDGKESTAPLLLVIVTALNTENAIPLLKNVSAMPDSQVPLVPKTHVLIIVQSKEFVKIIPVSAIMDGKDSIVILLNVPKIA
jgi:hypothetical protein